MKYFSLFTGIGGFDLALNNNNHTCVGMSEIDKYASMVLKYRFKGVINYGDAQKIQPKTLPDFNLLCGGFPCQAFSVAGKRLGFKDTRGTLFNEIARIAKSKKPNYILLENVKGLLNHEKGKTFQIIINTFRELGYRIDYGVLNSRYFGIPQNRERVFIIGSLREKPRPKIFPFRQTTETSYEKPASTTIDTNYWKGIDNHGARTGIIQLNNTIHSNNRVYSSKGLSPSLNTMQGGLRQPFIAVPVLTPNRINKRQNGRRFKLNGEPSFTVTAQDIHGVYNGAKIRKLTPLECERLQGFPDNWTKYGINDKGIVVQMSNTQRYKQCGNAVTVKVIEDIIKKINGG